MCVYIGRSVVYYARAAHTFSVGIKCRHCTTRPSKEFLSLWPSGVRIFCLFPCCYYPPIAETYAIDTDNDIPRFLLIWFT